jgi:hypothetical protein
VHDPTGPELLDALERLEDAAFDGSPARLDEALVLLPRDWQEKLRSLLRTPEETAVLLAAAEWRKPVRLYGHESFQASARLDRAVDAYEATKKCGQDG